MPLRKAKASRVEDGPTGGALVEFSGILRSPGEPDALNVKLGIRDSEITLHAEGAQLGSWPAEAVAVRRFGKAAFEFTAEGDRLIFTPDDPAAFGDSPLVVGRVADTDAKGGKSRRRAKRAEPRPTRDRASVEEQPPSERESKKGPRKSRLRKRPRRRQKISAEAAGEESATLDVVPDSGPVAPEVVSATPDNTRSETDTPTSDGRRLSESPESDDASPTRLRKAAGGVWIWTLDLARKYDTFGLDRVPIDVNLRGQEHQHTWDHRVAATSGLGKHICTICGAVRR